MRCAAIVGLAVVLATGWSSAAYSRTQNGGDCLEKGETLPGTLHITRIDHMPIPADSDVSAMVEEQVASQEAPTPLLDLTPRAASTLRDVFDTVEIIETDETLPVEVPVSPIAEMEELPDVSELPDNITPVAPLDTEIDLPLLRRQMFRTDI